MSEKKENRAALSDAHNARGIELADRGWLDEAVKEFLKALELDPESAHAHDNLATVYSEKKLYREALFEYLSALRLEPESATAHYNLACFLAGHAADMGIAEYQTALLFDPDYPDARLNLGLALADEGRTAEAIAELKAAAALAPRDPLPRQELAAIHMDEGDFRAAVSLLKEVVRLEPGNFEAHLDLGISYAQKGFFAEAESAYEMASTLSGDELLLAYNRAALYAAWHRPEAALASLRRALELDREKVRAWLQGDPMFDGLHGLPEYEAMAHGS